MKYIWTCPSWVPFQSCNIRINKPLIKVNLNAITDKKYIKTDTLYDMKVQVLAGGSSKGAYTGFFIVYNQPNFNTYFNFTIKNSTAISYNEDLNFAMEFNNKIHSKVIKDNIRIKWNINTTDAYFINGFTLPDFRVNFFNTSGTFNLTCTIFYRNGTFAQKTLSKSFFFDISNPPNTGILEAYPPFSLTLTDTRISLLASNFLFEDDPTNKNFRYEYFYRNIFGEYLWIINKYDNPNQLTRSNMPITDSVKVKCIYDTGTSNVEAQTNLTVKMNSLINYNKIDEIFIFEVENVILLLEAYSLNLRNHKMASTAADYYSKKILNRLYELFVKNNKTESRKIIHLNDDKIATILEAISIRFINYTQISQNFTNVIYEIMTIAHEEKDDVAFNLFYCNNYLRALDNLLNINPHVLELSKTDFDILENYKELLMLSYREIPKGAYKLANLKNLNIFGLTVDAKFLKNDIVYINNPSLNPLNTSSPIFFGDYSDLYLEGKPSPKKLDALSVTIPSGIIERFEFDFIPIIKQFLNWNIILDKNENYTEDSWYPIHSNIIEVSFVTIEPKNRTKYILQNVTESIKNGSTVFNKTFEKNITVYELSPSEKEYKLLDDDGVYIESELIIINFTLSEKYPQKILNYTSCVKIGRDYISEKLPHRVDDLECNTWFDFSNNIIQCECDTPGYYTVAYNPKFKYSRKHIQFPQTSDSIGNLF